MNAIVKAVLFALMCLGGSLAGVAMAARPGGAPEWCTSSPNECAGTKSCTAHSFPPAPASPVPVQGYTPGVVQLPIPCYLLSQNTVKKCDVSYNDLAVCCGTDGDIVTCTGISGAFNNPNSRPCEAYFAQCHN